MVPILNFTRKFSNEKRQVMNFSHTDGLVFPYICCRINLDITQDLPIYTEAVVICLVGLSWADDLRNHTPARHRLPLSVRPVNAAKCDLGVLARRAVTGRDPVVDLVTMSHGVDRQTLELLARTVCQASVVRRRRRMRNIGLSEEGRGRSAWRLATVSRRRVERRLRSLGRIRRQLTTRISC
jgi:hypothetical protein